MKSIIVKSSLMALASALTLTPITSVAQTSTQTKHKPSAVVAAKTNTTEETAAQEEAAETQTAPAPTRSPAALPAGTAMKMKLETALSTSTSRVGDKFAGRVTEDVEFQGKTVIPVGSSIHGRVVRVSEQRRYKGLPTLELHPEEVTLPNGDKYKMNAVVADTSRDSKTSVDEEGRIKGQGMDRRDKLEIAGGTAAGAGLGALISHGAQGTLVGAAVGGASAVVYWLTKHKSASLAPGTEIIMELNRPMTINAASD